MFISVCVAAVRASTLPMLLSSLERQSYPLREVILVTQGAELYRGLPFDLPGRVRHAHLEQRGKCGALNYAATLAEGDVLAFTDDDCEADPRWLEVLAKRFQSHPEVGLVAGITLAPRSGRLGVSVCPHTPVQEAYYSPEGRHSTAPPNFYWGGANVAVRSELFSSLGGFDPFLGPGTAFPGAEDVDFALRAEHASVTMVTTPEAVVRHTYGRRYGVGAVRNLAEHYARGQGALGAKLVMWQHPLSRLWGTPTPLIKRTLQCIRAPHRALLQQYQRKFVAAAYEDCLARFTLDGRALLCPKPVAGEACYSNPSLAP